MLGYGQMIIIYIHKALIKSILFARLKFEEWSEHYKGLHKMTLGATYVNHVIL